MANELAMHETLELHEIMNMKVICAAKTASMAPLVKNEQLKELLQASTELSKQSIQELTQFVKVQ